MAAKKIRIGVVGARRGASFARASASIMGYELVALCDTWEEKLYQLQKQFSSARNKVVAYTDYRAFLEHDMDAVVLANYFHEHTPFAVQALEAGKHVMCECTAAFTLAECVQLVRAVEKSKKIFMLAENYPYMVFNQEMRRLFHKGMIGDFLYGEGEYVHPDPADVKNARSCGIHHWRNWLPRSYYCTHSLAPVMYITDTRPVKVNGFLVPYDYNDPSVTMTAFCCDTAASIMLRMDNGAVVKLLQGGLRGHQNFVRIHGNRGLMENSRFGDKNMLRIRREPFDKKKSEPVETMYLPDFPIHHKEATRAGHGGGDFFTNYEFAQAIKTGKQPFLDVYRAVDMSAVGILSYRSALNDSAPLDIPDFRKKSVRKEYENDHWNPDPQRRTKDDPLPSILGKIKHSVKGLTHARKIWKEAGYDGE